MSRRARFDPRRARATGAGKVGVAAGELVDSLSGQAEQGSNLGDADQVEAHVPRSRWLAFTKRTATFGDHKTVAPAVRKHPGAWPTPHGGVDMTDRSFHAPDDEPERWLDRRNQLVNMLLESSRVHRRPSDDS